MFSIQAPYIAPSVLTFLPNPLFGDSIANTNTVEVKRSMNGKKYTNIVSRDNRVKLIWTFSLSRMKFLELRFVYDNFSSTEVKITDHLGREFIGYFLVNPIEGESTAPAKDMPGGEVQQVLLEFEGYRLE